MTVQCVQLDILIEQMLRLFQLIPLIRINLQFTECKRWIDPNCFQKASPSIIDNSKSTSYSEIN